MTLKWFICTALKVRLSGSRSTWSLCSLFSKVKVPYHSNPTSSFAINRILLLLWLEVQAGNYKSFLICTAYKLLSTTKGYFDVISAIHILGDLNYILLKSSDPALQALINFCISLNLTQLINQPTRITESSATLMNVILASNKNLVRDTKVISVSISDH